MSRIDHPLHDQEAGSADSTPGHHAHRRCPYQRSPPADCPPRCCRTNCPCRRPSRRSSNKGAPAVADILQRRDDRLLVIVGPCSIHDHDQAIDFARLLKTAADALKDDLSDRNARLLREAAHHGRLEGLHQRPASRRQLPHQTRACAARASCCWRSAASACPPAPNSSTCSARNISPT